MFDVDFFHNGHDIWEAAYKYEYLVAANIYIHIYDTNAREYIPYHHPWITVEYLLKWHS